jgi:energy-coupling factor transporter ATP-binding protein EcfA2
MEINDFRQFKNVKIVFGKYITCLAGFNGTGKTTIMGLAGNSMKLSPREAKTISKKQFNIEFRELFKGSTIFDKTKHNVCTVYFSENSNPDKITACRISRVTWQNKGTRFRIIPEWKEPVPETDKTITRSSKFPMPSLYLGLSRLYPVGETADKDIHTEPFELGTDDKEWFIKNYRNILSIYDIPTSFESITITKASNKTSIGISTEKYDYLTNSSGQDSLSQILLSVLSFKKCKEIQKNNWKGGVLFIDEIDATLHPAAQLRLCKFLFSECKSINMQIVFTTHSYSLIQDIAQKTRHNSNEKLNNYQLIYLTNANQNKISIIPNPSLSLIRSDLYATPLHQQKITVFCEDKANRAFLRGLIPQYLQFVNIEDNLDLGCSELKNLYYYDSDYFSRIIFVLDGDVRVNNKFSDFIKNSNVVTLPTELPPDQLLFEYLRTTTREDVFDLNTGYSKRNIIETGPLSDNYSTESLTRRKYSVWFYNNQDFFIRMKSFEHWAEDNINLAQEFLNSFKKAYNFIAEKNGNLLIS